MRISSHILLSIAVLLLLSISLAAQDPAPVESPPEDTVFVEMLLDEEGVTAYDSIGRAWFYDFNNEQFVIGDYQRNEGDRELSGLETDFLPVQERCTEKLVVKQWGRTVLVGVDEYVEGNIIATGQIRIKGWVQGDVRSVNGRVLISSSGQVDGNVTAKEIIVKDGGIVLGEQIQSDNPLENFNLKDTFNLDGIKIVVIFMVLFYLFGLLFQSTMPVHAERFGACLHAHRFKSMMLGFLLFFLLPVIIALAAITIVGIILIPFIPLFYLLAIIFGVSAFSRKIGHGLNKRILRKNTGRLFDTFIGLSLFWLLWLIVAILLGSSSPVAEGFGVFFLVVAILVSILPTFAGIGAAFLTRFGVREFTSWKEKHTQFDYSKAPAPPPIPHPPDYNNRSTNGNT